MRIIITTILSFCLISNISAQNFDDSLQLYSQNIQDTASLNKLISYCFNNHEAIPDAAYKYSQLALKKSSELGSKASEARSYTNLGSIEVVRGNYVAALELYMKGLAIWEVLKVPRGIMMNKNNIAQVYGYLKKPEIELQFLSEAETIARQYHLEEGLGLIKLNLAVYYSNKKNYREAFNQQMEAITINAKLNKLPLLSTGYTNAGAFLIYLNQIDSSVIFFKQAKLVGEKIKDTSSLAFTYANLGDAFVSKKMTDSAIYHYQESIKFAKTVHLKEVLSYSYEQLSAIYKKKGDYAKALAYFELKQTFKDSILNSTMSKQIAEMQTKYETEKKERKIEEQHYEIAKRNYWITAIICSFLILGIFIYSFYRRKQLRQEALMQATLRKSEELASKSILEAEENERKRIATDLHDGIGQIMSAAKMNLSAIENDIPFTDEEQKLKYQKIIHLIDESCVEVRSISHNMMPNALLKYGLASAVRTFLDNVHSSSIKINFYSEGLDIKLDSNLEAVLYRVIQEAVNNVIKHAQASNLDITLIRDENNISVTIEDDGIGFDQTKMNKGDGIGLKNIKSRITYLKGSVEWDTMPEMGTAIIINIPI
ncbi:MAG TPA: sensor histidine kinase [Sediminibacterium sp.]|nr:sensor histidine kinase [Sediminibacterium sp.]